ncbi:unnamed protein product [Lasius platythorax]|uniref:SAP domain-containing protein n=1 Tax=Lasius platythorax TaxID=488582 RepID=A0AAV2MXX9_9HYME
MPTDKMNNNQVSSHETELNSLTLSQLQQECRHYDLAVIPKSKSACIRAILDHLGENGPLNEACNTQFREAMEEAQLPISSAQVSNENNVQDNASNRFQMPNMEYLPQFCVTMTEAMEKQQEMIEQLVKSLSLAHKSTQDQLHQGPSFTTSAQKPLVPSQQAVPLSITQNDEINLLQLHSQRASPVYILVYLYQGIQSTTIDFLQRQVTQ